MGDKPFSKDLGGDPQFPSITKGGTPDVSSGAANRNPPRTNLGGDPDWKTPRKGSTPDVGPSPEKHI